jgi:hypothetical protein
MTAYLISLAWVGLIAIGIWEPRQGQDWSCRLISQQAGFISGAAEEIEISSDRIYVDRVARSMAIDPGRTP